MFWQFGGQFCIGLVCGTPTRFKANSELPVCRNLYRSVTFDCIFRSECKQCFQLFDKEGNGKVNVSELGTMVRALGQMPTEGQVKELVDTIIREC